MSKKTRKKSSKAPAKPSAAQAARGGAAAPGRTPTALAGRAAAKKSGKIAKSVSAKASHKAPSKSLKSDQSGKPKSGVKPALVAGAKAPAFHLPRDGSGSVSLADYAGKKLVLFFYPRADTPGCTREAIDFTRLKRHFAESGTEVLGISADTVKTQESFRNKHQLTIPLISDERHEMLEAYGAWGEKSLYGRTFLGIIRTTVLIDADGRIAKIWRNVRVDGHADQVLAAARAL
ncbi:MAG: peroxiredoxin [Bradyrhizobium sp.]